MPCSATAPPSHLDIHDARPRPGGVGPPYAWTGLGAERPRTRPAVAASAAAGTSARTTTHGCEERNGGAREADPLAACPANTPPPSPPPHTPAPPTHPNTRNTHTPRPPTDLRT